MDPAQSLVATTDHWDLRDEGRNARFGGRKYERLSASKESLLVTGKGVPEHRRTAFRLVSGGLVLQDVPMFGKHAVLDAYYVGGDPVGFAATSGKPAVQDDVLAVSDDQLVFVMHLF